MGVVSSFDIALEENLSSYLAKIRTEIHQFAENWFHIAYYVYEMQYFKYYSAHYDNIVDCCFNELGFKKSTTYNFINIVNQCAKYKNLSYVGYNEFISFVRGWNYSQLVSMLSLSEKEREKATPDMSAREIKKLKGDSKRLENSEAPEVITVPEEFEVSAPAVVVDSEPAASPPAEVVESVSAAPASADVVSKDEFESVLCDYDARFDKLLEDMNEANDKYEAERDSNRRINIKLVDMTAERDKALQDNEDLKAQIKKLKADNRKLKAELKALKDSPPSK